MSESRSYPPVAAFWRGIGGAGHLTMLAAICLCGAAVGCNRGQGRQGAAAPPADTSNPSATTAAAGASTTAPATAPASASWQSPDKSVRLQYPAQWQPAQNPDYVLTLRPPGARGDERRITLDIPDLPPHLAFMIRMGSVRNGYVDDLKKAHADLNILAENDVKVPDSQARLVRASWHEGGRVEDDVALLIIHAGQVYILDARTDEQHLAQTRAAFDAVESSVQWGK